MRYNRQFALDSGRIPDGDKGWIGVDARRDPSDLEPGFASLAENISFRFSKPQTRGGIHSVTWAQDCALDFPVTFGLEATQDLYEGFTADPESTQPMNFRVQSGTTFQLKNNITGNFHSIWLETISGSVQFRMDSKGSSLQSWDFQPLDPPNANFRILDGLTFQLYNTTTGQWHTLYTHLVNGKVTLAIDPDGMDSGESGVVPEAPNFQVLTQTTFQLWNPELDLWHSVYASSFVVNDAEVSIHLDGMGMSAFGIEVTQDLFEAVTSSPVSISRRNYRVQSGTTFQARHVITGNFHSIWLETVNGNVQMFMDSNGQSLESYEHMSYQPEAANYRLLHDKTFQLLNVTTGQWHTVYATTLNGASTVAIDPDGMDTDETGIEPSSAAYQVMELESFQLLDPDVGLWFSIYVNSESLVSLVIDDVGINKHGVDFDILVGLGETFGETVFSDPNGVEGTVLAKMEYALLVRHGSHPERINYPPDTVISDPVEMFQQFDRVFMFRGEDENDIPLVWEPGLDFTNGLGSFESIEQTEQRGTDPDNTYGNGTKLIPNASDAIAFNNRMYIPTGKDNVTVSDILDFTRYNEATQVFRINSGSDDRLIRIFAYNQTTLILFKDQSIYLLSNVSGNLSQVRNDILTSEFGLVARDAVVQMGQDVWFLSEDGVFTLRQVLDNKLQATSEPVTGPVHPLIDRISWDYASGSQAVYDDNRYLLATPIDGSKHNNAILVWDWLSKAWSGYWTAPWMNVKAFIRTNYGSRRRLFILQGPMDGEYSHLEGALFLMDEGLVDMIPGSDVDINSEFISRGYDHNLISHKKPGKGIVDISTWCSRFSIDALSDGVNEVHSARVDIERDRLKYFVHGSGKYDPTNVNDDHGEPYRQDYSVVMHDSDELCLGVNGVELGRMQRAVQPVKLRRRGQYTQFHIKSHRGRIEIHGMELESRSGRRNNLVKA